MKVNSYLLTLTILAVLIGVILCIVVFWAYPASQQEKQEIENMSCKELKQYMMLDKFSDNNKNYLVDLQALQKFAQKNYLVKCI